MGYSPEQEGAPWHDERMREALVRALVKRLRHVGCDVPTAMDRDRDEAVERDDNRRRKELAR